MAFVTKRWLAVLLPGAILYFAPLPGFSPQQRHLLAVFAAAVVALVAQPVPMAVSVLASMTLLALTGTVAPAKVLSGFSNPTVWLIFTAFLFARAVTATGFGMRVAYLFIQRFGGSALALGYSISAANLVLAPFVPSDTARGGGILYPISRAVASAMGSEPGPTAGRIGSFLMLVGFHSNYMASAMFLTSMAANPMIAEFARKIAHVELTWTTWALAASLPGLLSLILAPLLIYKLNPPELRQTHAAREVARMELGRMGAMTRREWLLVVAMLGVMAGWVTSPWHGMHNAFVALGGVCAILLLGVVTWADLLSEGRAWDALMWFAPLLMLSDQMQESGVIRILSAGVFASLQGMPWLLALLLLAAAYLYVHYMFASMTAQVMALYPGFLAAALLAGAPPLLAAQLLGVLSSLNACLTHYGTGSAPIYFGAGYVGQARWWQVGFLVSLLLLAIWLGVGLLWWRLVGLW